ncbi:MAG: hypothetical protein V4582_00550 [Pseudomonadota bacterium]
MRLAARARAAWLSFRSLPIWVQCWVGALLVPLNGASFLMLDTPSGQWAAWAGAFVALANIGILLAQAGVSRLMALPHLLAWMPLQLALAMRLAGMAPVPAGEQRFALALLAVNGLSVLFDVGDAWRWCRGERGIAARSLQGAIAVTGERCKKR